MTDMTARWVDVTLPQTPLLHRVPGGEVAPPERPILVLWSVEINEGLPGQTLGRFLTELDFGGEGWEEVVDCCGAGAPWVIRHDDMTFVHKDALLSHKLPAFPPYSRYLAPGFAHYVQASAVETCIVRPRAPAMTKSAA